MTDINQRKLAKDVAKEMDRRRTRRRMTVLVGALGAAIAAVMYLKCGKGWGTGGKGEGEGGKGVAAIPGDAGPARCAIRLTAAGLTVDGKQASRDEAIAACKRTSGADVLISGDARQGDWDELRGALEAASIQFFTREPRGVTPGSAGSGSG
jgi:hypothetical protein